MWGRALLSRRRTGPLPARWAPNFFCEGYPYYVAEGGGQMRGDGMHDGEKPSGGSRAGDSSVRKGDGGR
ncbi:hypothetical protein CABS01_12660 [Colletotrichum abscissum]|uniref:Uncharacterized protein n=1 Tax=Colletotrichum abscissum TaxID=1671311 RepID=A0A9P9XA54_9PEZI|nr:uncharacterized protein CABS01_12660 [Colletotrichum abscissum]KAI3543848.1 hypothetical protein CABS02_09918 [Colletotrichum abscissum]KAK1489509.1 hypothetical protein CABS01_12660 [Colletotrichum abscissum]